MIIGSRTPKISIVTPSLNQGRFLQQCIDSVASQGWERVEHFVIDGGSTDETLSVLERSGDNLSGYVIEPDGGAADAINKGFAKCTGDIVAWLNADDFYLPGAFESIAEAWRNRPSASFWFGNGVRVNEAGEVKSVFNPGTVLYNHRALVEGLDFILQPAAFINPKVLKDVGYLDTSLRWGFDWDLWIRLAGVDRPIPLQRSLAASREWGATLTAGGGFRRTEELRVIAEMHSGIALTPGAACYWLDTFSNAVRLGRGRFSDSTLRAIDNLWSNIQSDMRMLDVDALGMPTRDGEAIAPLVIAVDLYPLIPGVSGGIVPWVKGVLRAMARLYPIDKVILFHRTGSPPIEISGDNITYVELNEHPASFYDVMTEECQSMGVQAVIRTYPLESHPDIPFERQIFVIPDLQHEYFPEFFSPDVLASRRRAFTQALSLGGAIATMTEHSRSTILENSATLCNDIFLMPAALPEELLHEPNDADLPRQAKAFAHYFYMPGNLWAHKNHRRLLEAFAKALPALPANTGLILTGSADGLEKLMKDFSDLPVVHLGYVSHIQVAALFKNAAALVYFSLFEGFGMPVLEAFRYQTPVLCSNRTSLPEVGGDAVLSCDPTDVHAMAELMCLVFRQPQLRADLSAKAARRLAVYDWEEPARALRSALKRRAHAEPRSSKMPLISIVMPTRNHARFIRESIDSVLCQDYPNFELLVMDGASTDNTVEILKSYGDKIRWVSEPDNGQADAINKGMERARGQVLAYLNSDDVLLPGALSKVVNHFRNHPECDMVYGSANYIDKDGNITGAYATAEFSFERLMQDCCVCQPAAFWRRRVAERTGSFNVELETAMDYEYWLRMAAGGAIIHHTPEKLAQSRLHEDAKTLAMRGKIFEEIFHICEKHGGYVSHSYYCGLWAYKMYESWGGGPRLRKLAPHVHLLPALVHFSTQVVRLGRDRASRLHVARIVFHNIEHRMPALGASLRRTWRRSPTFRRIFGWM